MLKTTIEIFWQIFLLATSHVFGSDCYPDVLINTTFQDGGRNRNM